MRYPTKKDFFLLEFSKVHDGQIIWAKAPDGWNWLWIKGNQKPWVQINSSGTASTVQDPRRLYRKSEFRKLTTKEDLFAAML